MKTIEFEDKEFFFYDNEEECKDYWVRSRRPGDRFSIRWRGTGWYTLIHWTVLVAYGGENEDYELVPVNNYFAEKESEASYILDRVSRMKEFIKNA